MFYFFLLKEVLANPDIKHKNPEHLKKLFGAFEITLDDLASIDSKKAVERIVKELDLANLLIVESLYITNCDEKIKDCLNNGIINYEKEIRFSSSYVEIDIDEICKKIITVNDIVLDFEEALPQIYTINNEKITDEEKAISYMEEIKEQSEYIPRRKLNKIKLKTDNLSFFKKALSLIDRKDSDIIFQMLGDELKKDKEKILELIIDYPEIIKYIDESLQKDEFIKKLVVNLAPYLALEMNYEEYINNEEFLEKLAKSEYFCVMSKYEIFDNRKDLYLKALEYLTYPISKAYGEKEANLTDFFKKLVENFDLNEDEEFAKSVFNYLAKLNSWDVREAVSDSGFKLKNKKIAEDILIGYYNESLKKMIVNLADDWLKTDENFIRNAIKYADASLKDFEEGVLILYPDVVEEAIIYNRDNFNYIPDCENFSKEDYFRFLFAAAYKGCMSKITFGNNKFKEFKEFLKDYEDSRGNSRCFDLVEYMGASSDNPFDLSF